MEASLDLKECRKSILLFMYAKDWKIVKYVGYPQTLTQSLQIRR